MWPNCHWPYWPNGSGIPEALSASVHSRAIRQALQASVRRLLSWVSLPSSRPRHFAAAGTSARHLPCRGESGAPICSKWSASKRPQRASSAAQFPAVAEPGLNANVGGFPSKAKVPFQKFCHGWLHLETLQVFHQRRGRLTCGMNQIQPSIEIHMGMDAGVLGILIYINIYIYILIYINIY